MALPTASDNPFPSLLVTEGSAPSSPAAGKQRLFIDSADHLLKVKNSSGTVTSVGGGISGITVADEGGDLSTAATKLDFVGAGVVASGTGTTKTITIAGASGTTYGASIAYPTTFTGDNDDFASFSNWSDVSAFDTAEILNSTVGHLVTLGASKDQKKRFTLGTTKAAAFDFRWWGVIPDMTYWSAAGDAYLDLALKTSGDAHIVGFRLEPQATTYNFNAYCIAGGSKVSTNSGGLQIPRGAPISFRVTRDGSNNCRWYYGVGLGAAPSALFLATADNTPYNGTPSGTVARAEILIHTPSGPGASAQFGAFIDAFQSV